MASSSANISIDSSPEQTEKDFIGLILKLSKELEVRGIEKESFSELKFFKRLDSETQNIVVTSLKSYIKVIENITEITEDIANDLKFIWSAMKLYGLIPPSDFLKTHSKDSVFEIYNEQGQQIFRNFEFFNYVSYSLEQIFCLPWFEAYERDELVTAAMFEAVTRVASGEIKEVVTRPVPKHTIKELQSDFRNLIEIDITSGVPLQSKNGAGKFLGVFSKCCVLDSKLVEDEPTVLKKPKFSIV